MTVTAAIPVLTARADRHPERLLVRIGCELFALELTAGEEALEMPPLEPMPDAPARLLGMAAWRGRHLPVFTPEHALGAAPVARSLLLVLRDGERRVGIAVDDVLDVVAIDPATLRRPPVSITGDEVVVAVARRGEELISVLDAPTLVRACLGSEETSR